MRPFRTIFRSCHRHRGCCRSRFRWAATCFLFVVFRLTDCHMVSLLLRQFGPWLFPAAFTLRIRVAPTLHKKKKKKEIEGREWQQKKLLNLYLFLWLGFVSMQPHDACHCALFAAFNIFSELASCHLNAYTFVLSIKKKKRINTCDCYTAIQPRFLFFALFSPTV